MQKYQIFDSTTWLAERCPKLECSSERSSGSSPFRLSGIATRSLTIWPRPSRRRSVSACTWLSTPSLLVRNEHSMPCYAISGQENGEFKIYKPMFLNPIWSAAPFLRYQQFTSKKTSRSESKRHPYSFQFIAELWFCVYKIGRVESKTFATIP